MYHHGTVHVDALSLLIAQLRRDAPTNHTRLICLRKVEKYTTCRATVAHRFRSLKPWILDLQIIAWRWHGQWSYPGTHARFESGYDYVRILCYYLHGMLKVYFGVLSCFFEIHCLDCVRSVEGWKLWYIPRLSKMWLDTASEATLDRSVRPSDVQITRLS